LLKTNQLKRLQSQKTLAPEAAALMTMNLKHSLRRDRHLFLTIAATNAESIANREGQPEIRKKKRLSISQKGLNHRKLLNWTKKRQKSKPRT
jgi:hypothetical protein